MALVATVTIQASQVPSDLTDFVAYIDLAGMPAVFWSTVANGGGDIRCYKSDGTTELAREVVSCDTAADTGELHVKFAGVLSSSSNTEIQIHTDGTSADYAVTDTFGRNAVWSDYELVWHGESATTDSSGNYTLTVFGSPTPVAGGMSFDGVDDYIDTNMVSGVFTATQTLQVRVGGASAPASVGGSDAGRGPLHFESQGQFSWDHSSFSYRGAYAANIGGFFPLSFGSILANTNYFLSVTRGVSGVVESFKDGISQATASKLGDFATDAGLTLKLARHAAKTGAFWEGTIYDARATTIALSADWIATEYANQNSPATFYSIAANDAGGTDNVTPTGITTTPTLGTPAVGQVHALSATGIETTPTLGTPAVGQIHNLTATGIQTTPTLGTPEVGQVHSLAAVGITTTPTLGTPTAGETSNTDSVTPLGLTTTPTVGTPPVGQVHNLDAVGIETTPVLGRPTAGSVAGVDSVTPTGITVTATVGTPQIGQIHALSAVSIDVIPELGIPAVGQVHALVAVGVQCVPVLGRPVANELPADFVVTIPLSRTVVVPYESRTVTVLAGEKQ